VTTANGTTFVYRNPFGGYWIADPSNPFASGARPNSWTPALNETWTWGVDRVNGVNLGGWFPSAVDEWSLSTLMRADNTLQTTMEARYDGFVVSFVCLSKLGVCKVRGGGSEGKGGSAIRGWSGLVRVGFPASREVPVGRLEGREAFREAFQVLE
ncbi:hypothetical protein B0H16DRAFT_1317462, partial [Mycena metata]